MRYQRRSSVLFLAGPVLALGVIPGGASPALAAARPVAVSPGSASEVALIGDGCPTFSWGAAEGAKSYELVVYRLAEEGEETPPVLSETFAGSASSWTPSLDRCLALGGRYAWSLRAVTDEGESDWSPPALFQVASGLSEEEFEEALARVRRYLAEREAAISGVVGVRPPATVEARPKARGPAAQSHTGGSSGVAIGNEDITINGASVLTVGPFCDLLAQVDGTDTLGLCPVVFVTSQAFRSDLGGLTGADTKCNQLAAAAGLSGSFTAWLSNSSTDARTRLPPQGGPWFLPNGSLVAADLTQLISCDAGGTPCLANPIRVTETGTTAGVGVWTATGRTGLRDFLGPNQFCDDWTGQASNANYAMVGRSNSDNLSWTTSGVFDNCFSEEDAGGGFYIIFNRLYCFET